MARLIVIASMRRLLLVVSLSFTLATFVRADPETAPGGQTPAPGGAQASEAAKDLPAPSTEGEPKAMKMSPAEIQKKKDEYYEQCMKDWDAATHMTKQEWQRTCKRMVENRVKFLIEQMGQ
jgi:hypothetical protein